MITIRWKALRRTKEEIIKHLQLYLTNEDNYKYMIPKELSMEHIRQTNVYDTEPNQLVNYPIIILNSGNGSIISGGLGDVATEIRNGFGDLIGYRYGGMYDFNIVLEIATKSTFSREFMADLIAMALRVQLRRKLEASGILIKDVKFTGESSLQINSDKVYVSNLSLSIWAEWYEDIELLPIDDVNINIKQKS